MGDLQATVLGVLRRLRKASAKQVQREICYDRKIAYTTVSTVLDRLYRKGLVARKRMSSRGGSKYIYFCTTPEEVRRNLVQRALTQLVSAFGPSIVPTIYSSLEVILKPEPERPKMKARQNRRAS